MWRWILLILLLCIVPASAQDETAWTMYEGMPPCDATEYREYRGELLEVVGEVMKYLESSYSETSRPTLGLRRSYEESIRAMFIPYPICSEALLIREVGLLVMQSHVISKLMMLNDDYENAGWIRDEITAPASQRFVDIMESFTYSWQSSSSIATSINRDSP